MPWRLTNLKYSQQLNPSTKGQPWAVDYGILSCMCPLAKPAAVQWSTDAIIALGDSWLQKDSPFRTYDGQCTAKILVTVGPQAFLGCNVACGIRLVDRHGVAEESTHVTLSDWDTKEHRDELSTARMPALGLNEVSVVKHFAQKTITWLVLLATCAHHTPAVSLCRSRANQSLWSLACASICSSRILYTPFL